MWSWRRMEKIKWLEKVSNEQVLDRIGEKRTLLNNILRRKANWIGHILRRNCLLHDVIEGLEAIICISTCVSKYVLTKPILRGNKTYLSMC